MNERNHEQTKSTVVGMDRKAAAKPPKTPRLPATPAVTRTQTVDVRASKARALAFMDTLPNHNSSTTTRSASEEGPRRRTAVAAASEAAAAQQRRAEGMAARVVRPARAEPTTRHTEVKAEIKAEAREGLSADAHAPGPRAPAPMSPGRALLESIAARDASEVSQLREALLAETESADNAEAFASSFVDRKYEYTETMEASIADLKLSLATALEERDAARGAQTPALQKATAKYASVRDSLDVMLNRADQLESELREERLARRRDHAVALLRRFTDRVLFDIRLRRVEAETFRRFGITPASTDQRAVDDDRPESGSDSDSSHQSRLERVAQHTIDPTPGVGTAPAAAPLNAAATSVDVDTQFSAAPGSSAPSGFGVRADGASTHSTPDGDPDRLCRLPNCPRRVWDSHTYCGRTHAMEHAALVSYSLAHYTDAEDSAEAAAQFFHQSVRGAVRSAVADGEYDLPGCRNARAVDVTAGRHHRYCCTLHSEAHLIEPCEGPGEAPDDGGKEGGFNGR